MERRTGEVVLEHVLGRFSGLESSQRARLAEADTVAEAFSGKNKSVARPFHGEESAPQRLDAEGARGDLAEHLAADDERPGAAKDDLLGAARRVAPRDFDPIEPGAH